MRMNNILLIVVKINRQFKRKIKKINNKVTIKFQISKIIKKNKIKKISIKNKMTKKKQIDKLYYILYFHIISK